MKSEGIVRRNTAGKTAKIVCLALVVAILIVCLMLAACDDPDEKRGTLTSSDTTTDTTFEDDDNSTEEEAPPDENTSGLREFSDVIWGDETVVYDGKAHVIVPQGLPFGTVVTYSRENCVDAGKYELTATLKLVGYKTLVLTATLTILPAHVDVTFEDCEFVWDGLPHYISVKGELPPETIVTYEGNGQSEVGSYTVTAHVDPGANYEPVEDLHATLTIKERIYVVSFVHWDGTVIERRVPRGGSLSPSDYPANWRREGYNDMMWDPADLALLSDVRENVTVHEIPGSVRTYVVEIDPAGGINNAANYSETIDGVQYLYYTVESDIYLRDPYRYGYVFIGWYDENGKRVSHLPDGELRDMKLTAQWMTKEEFEQSQGGITPTPTDDEFAANAAEIGATGDFACAADERWNLNDRENGQRLDKALGREWGTGVAARTRQVACIVRRKPRLR